MEPAHYPHPSPAPDAVGPLATTPGSLTDSATTAVATFYRDQLVSARQRTAALEVRARVLSNLRLASFLLLLLTTAYALWSDYAAALGALAAVLLLLVTVIVIHEKLLRRIVESRRATQFWMSNLDRVENRWAGTGIPGTQFLDPHHLYAEDLDLFGAGSLFELLCSARTTAGEQQLAQWLCLPSSPQDALARQQAVRELAPNNALREDLAMVGPDVRALVHPDALVTWGTRTPRNFAPWERVLARLLPVISLTAVIACFGFVAPYSLLAGALLAQTLFAWHLRRRVLPILEHAGFAARDLGVLALVLRRFEAEHFQSPLLTGLREQLSADAITPGQRIARLSRLSELLDSRQNQAFGIIAPFLLWSSNFAIAIEAWRAENGPQLARWLQAVGELEALCSLARYAFEHPHDCWPEFLEGPPAIDAEAVGHPLIPESVVVRNSVSLSAQEPLLMISGSNMSGKSTMLRATGINLVLALAGAPVRAVRFRTSPFRLGASIRVSDNLLEGESRFYAEIRRVRDILTLAEQESAVLFLLDEIFSGTNSHDRRIGAQAILRSLVERGAVGMVTTHDLALTRIEEALSGRVRNVHFEDEIIDGRMHFDYRMRPGVVTRSNAVALMRSIGIDL